MSSLCSCIRDIQHRNTIEKSSSGDSVRDGIFDFCDFLRGEFNFFHFGGRKASSRSTIGL